jgi:hypothetical protein
MKNGARTFIGKFSNFFEGIKIKIRSSFKKEKLANRKTKKKKDLKK